MTPTDYHPFTRARLRKAVRALLSDRHGHPRPDDMIACQMCRLRLWKALGDAAPKAIMQGV